LSAVRAAKVKKSKAVAAEKAKIAAQEKAKAVAEKRLNDEKSVAVTEKKDGESGLAGKKITNFVLCPSFLFYFLFV